jgi:hypothetical protein
MESCARFFHAAATLKTGADSLPSLETLLPALFLARPGACAHHNRYQPQHYFITCLQLGLARRQVLRLPSVNAKLSILMAEKEERTKRMDEARQQNAGLLQELEGLQSQLDMGYRELEGLRSQVREKRNVGNR